MAEDAYPLACKIARDYGRRLGKLVHEELLICAAGYACCTAVLTFDPARGGLFRVHLWRHIQTHAITELRQVLGMRYGGPRNPRSVLPMVAFDGPEAQRAATDPWPEAEAGLTLDGLAARLSEQDAGVLRLLAEGCTPTEIGDRLGITLSQVKCSRIRLRRAMEGVA